MSTRVSDEDIDLAFGEEAEVDELTKEFVHNLIVRIIVFCEMLSQAEMFPYQREFAYRIIESLIIGDGEEVTALFSRQCLDGDTVVFRRDGTAVRLRNHEDAWSTGVKPTKRYIVRGGGEIVATDNHPVMTPSGWVPAGLLREGDYVATLDGWDVPSSKDASPEMARFLGYLVTDGSFLMPKQSPKFTNIREEYLIEVEVLAEKLFDITAKRYPKGNGFDLLLTAPGRVNRLTATLRGMEWDHAFPTEVFAWSREAVGEFVNRAWSGDGSVRVKRDHPDVFLACGNDEVYARYWQALLLRWGIRSTVKREQTEKGTGTFHRLIIANGDVRAFFSLVGEVFGKEKGSRAALAACAPLSERLETWPCPGVSKHLYRDGYGGDRLDACVRCGSTDPRKALGMGKGGAARKRPTHVGQDGERLAFSRIVRIEDAGEREVFDVTYEDKGWFIAQGVQVHNSGKTETTANVVGGCMVLLPKLAKAYPQLLGKFAKGLWVGCFAPTESQAETLFSRIVSRLSSDHSIEILLDPEIDDKPVGGGKIIRLEKSGSFCRMQTANPRAKIESKSYHVMILDEAQEADDYTVRKSIHPMGAFYNATIVKTGTPSRTKGDFYKAIQLNKRRQTRRGARKNHYEADWRHCAKYNPNYNTFIRKEILRLGEDSDEFRLSYSLEWLLERGMFVTSSIMEELGDKSMEIQKAWWKTPIVIGIDPARSHDSTVCTAVWVDWDFPDEMGFFDHRVLDWLEIQGEEWENQYFEIISWARNFDIYGVAVDGQGMGSAVGERLQVLMPGVEVSILTSTAPEQAKRWTHLTQLIQRQRIGWPAHAKTRRLKTWQRFNQQMVDLEKKYQGPHLLAEAPKEAEAHDDFPDSLALACVLTRDSIMPSVEVSENPFYSSR